jgi:hypothetical protein
MCLRFRPLDDERKLILNAESTANIIKKGKLHDTLQLSMPKIPPSTCIIVPLTLKAI